MVRVAVDVKIEVNFGRVLGYGFGFGFRAKVRNYTPVEPPSYRDGVLLIVDIVRSLAVISVEMF